MQNYILSCGSTADLSEEHYRKRDLHVIYYSFELSGKKYVDDFGKSIPYDEYYRRIGEGEMTHTTQINAEAYEAYFESFLKEGKDVLHVTLSSGITGTMNSANLARQTLLEKYPERKLYIVDSLSASAGYGLLMDKLADLRDEGKTLEEVRDWALENRTRMHCLFFSTDLQYYVRGGRISKAAAFIGSMASICPLMEFDRQGKMSIYEKIRTKKKAIRGIVERMNELADEDFDEHTKYVMIGHSSCLEDAQAVADLIRETHPDFKGKIEINYIGTTIGAHTGPGTVSLLFWGKERES